MRNKVGQVATEEMSAFKGVVNLFIVVLLCVSQRVTYFQGGERIPKRAAKSYLTAHETVPSESLSFATRRSVHVITLQWRRKGRKTLLPSLIDFLKSFSLTRWGVGRSLCALNWRTDEVTETIYGAHRLQVEAFLLHSLSVCFLWMIKAGKMSSSSSTLVWRRSGRGEILAVIQGGGGKRDCN